MPSKETGAGHHCHSSCTSCAGCGNQNGAAKSCPRPGCCGSNGGGCPRREIIITEQERDFLLLLGQIPFLPLARLVGKQMPEGASMTVLQAPVYLDTPDDDPAAVRETGAVLQSLEAKRLITLDYDKPLKNGDYSMFYKSRFYQSCLLPDTESSSLPVFEFGSIALTALGQAALDSI